MDLELRDIRGYFCSIGSQVNLRIIQAKKQAVIAVRESGQSQLQSALRLLLIENLHLRSYGSRFRQAVRNAHFRSRQRDTQLSILYPRSTCARPQLNSVGSITDESY
jgi:hypothetical protein